MTEVTLTAPDTTEWVNKSHRDTIGDISYLLIVNNLRDNVTSIDFVYRGATYNTRDKDVVKLLVDAALKYGLRCEIKEL